MYKSLNTKFQVVKRANLHSQIGNLKHRRGIIISIVFGFDHKIVIYYNY